MAEPSISVWRDMAAPAERIFSVLVRPAAHSEVDGSGMVRSATEDVVISAAGDVFVMKMWNDNLGDYVIENRVVEFDAGRRIVWEPVLQSVEDPDYRGDLGVPAHAQWGWQLEALDAERTRVTEFFDCSRSPEWLQNATQGGERWRPAIEASLANLDRMVVDP